MGTTRRRRHDTGPDHGWKALDRFGFSMSIEKLGEIVYVRPRGDLDVMTAPQLSRALDSVAVVGAGTVVVDLSRVTFVDCAGLAPIRRALAAEPGRMRLRLVGAPPRVDRVMRLTGLRPHRHTDD
jgi:anti-anti-sigma factor